MNLICPKCKITIKPESVNITTDLAKCDNCNSIFKVSELTHSQELNEISNPPKGSLIEVERNNDDSMELLYPRKGFTFSMIPQLLFTIFWIGFISFWTFMASRSSLIFASFSIPFWFVGFGMVIGIINSIFEIQWLKITRSDLTLIKKRPIHPVKIELLIEDIQSIRMKTLKLNPFSMFGSYKYMFKMQNSFVSGIELPAIISGVKTENFFENANDAEQEWVTTTLENVCKILKRRLKK
jgi:hypothetical protein